MVILRVKHFQKGNQSDVVMGNRIHLGIHSETMLVVPWERT